jgi:hypothetical protein
MFFSNKRYENIINKLNLSLNATKTMHRVEENKRNNTVNYIMNNLEHSNNQILSIAAFLKRDAGINNQPNI